MGELSAPPTRRRRRRNRVYVNNSANRAYGLVRASIHRLAPDDRLVEDELMRGLSASRGIVRAVLQRLADEGVVIRRTKIGTTPVQPIVLYLTDDLSSLDDPAPDVTSRIFGEVLQTAVTTAPAAIQLLLERNEPCPITMVEEVMYYEDTPFATTVMYIDRVLQDVPLPGAHLPGRINYLEDAVDAELVLRENTLGAAPCDEQTADRLGIALGTPIIWRQTVLRDVAGIPHTVCQMRYRSDRVTFVASAQARRQNRSSTSSWSA